ncbi:dienelactone hydrolase family protein [Hypoxylon fragiforme]|uniref:dienelactone hydrolase family protein n=1 Tax=Hypoxylon fragiforme TaxID=63214 RepID=UPI0020C654B9|nr:dienelactone hydrolase family protein [Hypoxylon fragiforme]KAI2609071.1 dienelactone hydrolase family protein [Hypoxylon fragiforme]
MSLSSCCLKGFEWSGTPTGKVSKLGANDVYIAGTNPDAAILIVHDIFGWTFNNARLLADHYAREANATVYLPDFFGGWVVDPAPFIDGDFSKFDAERFRALNGRDVREPEIFAAARELRGTHKKLGAIGFCYGGWAVLRLAAKEHTPPLVDCVATAHPSLLTHKDIDDVAVPVQLLAPENDFTFTAELKSYAFDTLQKNNVQFDYRYFPGIEHGALVRGDDRKPGERIAMARAKDEAVSWFNQFLH